MRRLLASTEGDDTRAVPPGPSWDDLALPAPWPAVLAVVAPGTRPRPAQVAALRDHGALSRRRNLIVSAPTNGGKTLVGLLCLLDAVRQGRRAVLLEPLRALAREKTDELETLAPRLGTALGLPRPLRVTLTTGDCRLSDETFRTPPPNRGEIVVATPERFDAVLRAPEHDPWLATVGAVCVDEAHLLADRRRGATLEYLLTALRALPAAPPRLVLLSATLGGGAERLRDWLAPCDLVASAERHVALCREVLSLDAGEDADQVLHAELCAALAAAPDARALVFVYQTRWAESLAQRLSKAGTPAAAYHARLAPAARQAARDSFTDGTCRVLVATTALGLGVNLPATHVFVRDTALREERGGEGRLSAGELLQMTGRAGRGDTPGRAAVLVRPSDPWDPDELATALRAGTGALPPVSSPFLAAAAGTRGRRSASDPDDDPATVAPFVAAVLARRPEDGHTEGELRAFFDRSLAGTALSARVPAALCWLEDPARVLAFRHPDTGRHRLTVLGLRAARALLPLPLAAGVAQLLRDLLTLAPDDGLLAGWCPLDSLLVIALLAPAGSASPVSLRPYSAALVDRLDAWMERRLGEHGGSLLYRRWIAGAPETSRARDVLGSLGLSPGRGSREGSAYGAAHKAAYLALFRSALLWDRSQGMSTEDMERAWSVCGWEGIENRWRDESLWLLSGLADLLELRCFYHHLVEGCGAADHRARVRRVKGLLRRMRAQVLALCTDLAYCSPLGPALHSLRQTLGPHAAGRLIGPRTVRRLEDAGLYTLADLASVPPEELTTLGLRPRFAEQLQSYLRRRMQ